MAPSGQAGTQGATHPRARPCPGGGCQDPAGSWGLLLPSEGNSEGETKRPLSPPSPPHPHQCPRGQGGSVVSYGRSWGPPVSWVTVGKSLSQTSSVFLQSLLFLPSSTSSTPRALAVRGLCLPCCGSRWAQLMGDARRWGVGRERVPVDPCWVAVGRLCPSKEGSSSPQDPYSPPGPCHPLARVSAAPAGFPCTLATPPTVLLSNSAHPM